MATLEPLDFDRREGRLAGPDAPADAPAGDMAGEAGSPGAPAWLGDESRIWVTEDDIAAWSPALLDALLADRSTGRSILWATDSHAGKGDGYGEGDGMSAALVTGENRGTVRPRVTKAKAAQAARTKGKAEVFTPSWVCNLMNNVVDRAWFGGEADGSPFNEESEDRRGWEPTEGDVPFPDEPPLPWDDEGGDGGPRRSWQGYVTANRMEMACGEAPYLVSRYDTTTGEPIPFRRRIGLLDRKLRVALENTMCDDEAAREWMLAALRSCYGFEYQGDSLLIARENMLWGWADAYRWRLGHAPSLDECLEAADIVSWNLWQMDAFTYRVPGTDDRAEIMNWATGTHHAFEEQVRRG